MPKSMSHPFRQAAITAVALLWACAALAQGAAERTPVLEKVIADRELFGEDGLAAIRAAAAWRGAVQRYLVIQAEQVVADRPLADPADPKAVTDLDARTQAAGAPRPGAAQRPPPDELAARAASLRAAVTYMPDDGTRRLAWRRDGAVFLKPGVKLADIERRYGKPQRVLTELVEAQGERRPAVLTIYEYDGGAVRFAASDFAATPDTVERVMLDVEAVQRVLAGSPG